MDRGFEPSGGPAGGPRPPLALTPAAEAEIARRLGELQPGAAFFVVTQPSDFGFRIGVGFETSPDDPGRPVRPELGPRVRVSDDDLELLRGTTIDYRDEGFVTFTDVFVRAGTTPNPRSRKFQLNRELIASGSATYANPVGEDAPRLARFLLEVPGVESVFFFRDFCSVTARAEEDWDSLQPEIGKRLQAYFAHGGGPLPAAAVDPARLGDVERRIMEVLEDVVRPAVAKDGGEIAFAGFEDGKVLLYLLGSCSGCPSSLLTLKMGVEEILKDAVPEVREVEALV
jgi:Fe-S cluster biogenesis protein NfuA/Fe-S cluster assembly iron-binding protein IscA